MRGSEEETGPRQVLSRGSGQREAGRTCEAGAPRSAPCPPSCHTRRPWSPGGPAVLGQVLTRGAAGQRGCDHHLLGDLPKQHKINPVLLPGGLPESSSDNSITRETMPDPVFSSPGRMALRLLHHTADALQWSSSGSLKRTQETWAQSQGWPWLTLCSQPHL